MHGAEHVLQAARLNLGVLAASGDRPLVHDRSTSSDQEYIGEVDRSADMVRCDPNERPQL